MIFRSANEGVFFCLVWFVFSFQIKGGKKERKMSSMNVLIFRYILVNICYDDDDDGDHKNVGG